VVTWIVVAVVVGALLVLALAVRPVLAALGPLRRAAVRLAGRQAQAQALADRATAVQQRLVDLQAQADTAQRRLAVLQSRRDG
jgi:hypothetical protein